MPDPSDSAEARGRPSDRSSFCMAAILLAAGRGTRMNGVVGDKILALIEGKSCFRRSFETFAGSGLFDRIVVVYRDPAQRALLSDEAKAGGIGSIDLRWTAGGARRQDSVFNGLAEAGQDTDYAFIHDCARPLVRREDIRRLREVVLRDKAATLGHPVADTIKRIDRRRTNLRKCRLKDIDRRGLWATETPQCFAYELIFDACQKARQGNALHTDDVSVASAAGIPVSLVESSFPNPKITRPADLALAAFLLRSPGHPSQSSP